MSQQLQTHQLNLFDVEMTKKPSQPQEQNKAQSSPLPSKTAKLWFDGGTFPLNPGHGGSGAVIASEGKEYSFSEYIGEKETNNRAEYGGLLLGLRKALEMGITHLEVYGDSQLVIYQMTGTYACRNSGLIPLWQKARKLAKQFQRCNFTWIPREKNGKADVAASEAIKQVMGNIAEIPDDLPICEPRVGLEGKIKILNKQGEGAKFKEWLFLKSGRDGFSSLRGEALEERIPLEVREAIANALTEEEKGELYEKALRWWLRGLKAACAVRKVRVDAEVSANFERK
jgi:ribonuclease HI